MCPGPLQFVEKSGCVILIDHILEDLELWACAYPLPGLIQVDSGHSKITVYSGFEGGNNPPKKSKPDYVQTFEWWGYQGDVSVSENGCLNTG